MKNGSTQSLRKQAAEFLDGRIVGRQEKFFSNILTSAFNLSVIDPEKLGQELGINTKDARNLARTGKTPNKKTQRRVVQMIFNNCPT